MSSLSNTRRDFVKNAGALGLGLATLPSLLFEKGKADEEPKKIV